jgi:hypothetical protein
MPLIFAAIQTFIFLVSIREEPYMYSISTENEPAAKQMMAKVFRKVPDGDENKTLDQGVDLQFEFIKMFTNMDSSSTTFGQATCGSNYRRATWIGFTLNVFNQMSGINGIIVYVNRLLVQLDEQSGGEFPLSPVTGSFLVGLSMAVFGFFPIFYVKKIGRKTIFTMGHVGMCASLFCCGLFVQ